MVCGVQLHRDLFVRVLILQVRLTWALEGHLWNDPISCILSKMT